jgi:hypothetical protein
LAEMSKQIQNHKDFWNQFVIPDYDEFFAEIENLRKAFHCASSLFHMADWLYQSNKAYIDANFTFMDKNGASQKVSDEMTFANAVSDLEV